MCLSSPCAAEVIINEFLASNRATLADEDGEFSDWVELYNSGPEPVNLAGWALSDDFEVPNKWVFPEVVLPGRSFLTVFCSGKDRRDPLAPLHTSFKLDAGGEYLALLKSDLRTATTQFFPDYGEQSTDRSAGWSQPFDEVALLPEGAVGTYHVPLDGSLGRAWIEPSFDDAFWPAGPTAIGFDQSNTPAFADIIATDIGARMRRINGSVYVRIPFEVADPAGFDRLRLDINYADGFVAYLNGVEIARRGVPADADLEWDADAEGSQTTDEALTTERIELGFAARAALNPGPNLLALHAMNSSSVSANFFVLPRVTGVVIGEMAPELRAFDQPTPNGPNGVGFQGISRAPELSVEGGAFAESVLVEITAPPGAELRFTLDGTPPGRDSELYTTPLRIEGTALLGVVAIEPGRLPSEAVRASYVILSPDVAEVSSNLPLVIVNTFGTRIVPDFWTASHIQIVDIDSSTGRAAITGQPHYAGASAVKVRGSSTAGRPKPSLNLELTEDFAVDRDTGGADKRATLLGMPEESDWILYGPYNFDHAHFRNKFIYDISNQVGRWATHGRFVELYLNQGSGAVGTREYYGVYVLFEKINADANRVDITVVEPDDLEEPEISGGYMFKIDRLDPGDRGFAGGGMSFGWVEPKESEVAPEQQQWLTGWLNQLNQAVRSRDPARYEEFIDVGSWIDHHILNVFPKNADAFRLSGYMYKDRSGKLVLGPIWDYDRSMGSTDGRDANPLNWPGGTDFFGFGWYGPLFERRPPSSNAHPWEAEYLARWREVRRGALATENVNALIDGYKEELAEAAVRNLAKWGPQSGGPRGGTFASEVEFTRDWILRRLAWMDSQFLQVPEFSHEGGMVAEPFELEMAHGNEAGEIFYTLDGEPPRLDSGERNPNAQPYTGPVRIERNTRVRAQVEVEEGVWSGEAEASYVFTLPTIALSELMYNPIGSRDFGFIELENYGAEPVELGGIFFEGVTFEFEPGTLAPGEFIVVVKDLESFSSRYDTQGIRIAGEFDSVLSTAGERLTLLGPVLEEVFSFRFDDDWHPTTDGQGRSLVLVDPTSDPSTWEEAEAWRASQELYGSPGRADPGQTMTGERLPGDANADADYNVSDAIFLLDHLFSGRGRLPCGDGAVSAAGNRQLLDGNGDAVVDASDVVHTLHYLFLSGAPHAQGTACRATVDCAELCGP